MAETVSPQPRAVEETPKKPSYASISNPSTYTKKSGGKLPLKLKRVIYVHGKPTVSFNFSDLESYIQEENLPDMIDLRNSFARLFLIKGDCNLGLLDHRHVLVKLSNPEDFMEVYSRALSFITIKEKGTPWFNPKEETSIALAWISFPNMSTQMFAHEALFSLASAVGTPLQVDKATTGKSKPSVARVKLECFFKDEKNGVVKEVLQKIVYDKLPSYCTTCKHQGHKEEECRLTMKVEGGLIDETKINGAKFEGDLRSILDEKKKVLSLQQTGKEVTLPTSFNSEKKNSVERVDVPDPLLVAATSGNKEDTETMLPGTLTSKISEQLGTTTMSSSTPVHIDVEAQNNVDNNSRQLIVTSQVAMENQKKGSTTTEKSNNQWTLVSHKNTVGSKSSNNHILHQNNSTHVEFDRSNSVVECTQFDVLRDEKFGQYEGLHVTDELFVESGYTLDSDKQIEQT
ncbi:hypothetical protein R3W88_024320 [Solanum pinnatisectum]|uniref:DUF4283 domain-containing protein n=1 Tax=Solanum pinnatisectum TaxID=50273 RepID=A0AAV9M089_9SOLN|nr:hypothetical protein R3W88_024320 [Solanum pinnatisectum]